MTESSVKRLRMNQAIVEALRAEMAADPTVVVFGEDVAKAGGVFKTSEGLLDEFGPARVRDTPISEMGFVGAGVGAAVTGLRPVVEIMFVEFLGVALDELVTTAAKFRYLSRGRVSVPLVVRASAGSGAGFGCQHSQTLETWFAATPGLKVSVASGPRTAYGLLRAAIRDDNPVVLLEPRVLYGHREAVDLDHPSIELGRCELAAQGTDATIVALGATVAVARAATDAAGWSADVIDLLTLYTWDIEAVVQSVRKTGRLVVVEETPRSGGWGADVVAEIAQRCHGDLIAPPCRLTAPDAPVPFGIRLEREFMPSADSVRGAVDALLKNGEIVNAWWEEPA